MQVSEARRERAECSSQMAIVVSPGPALKAEVPQPLYDHLDHCGISEPDVGHQLSMLLAYACDLLPSNAFQSYCLGALAASESGMESLATRQYRNLQHL